jgi:predicted metal-dependent HD superfamily phosphohydrolase
VDLREGWTRAWEQLGATADGGLLQELIARYSEPHRSYHTLRHLEECFVKLEELRPLAERPAEVELALWFHDAIYDPRRHDNEERSADWASESALAHGLEPAVAQRLHALVITTRHEAGPHGVDQAVLVDIDLCILAASPERFDEYEKQVREEYRWVPALVYRRRRKAILQSFASRSTIYRTPLFIERYERPARENLVRSLARL